MAQSRGGLRGGEGDGCFQALVQGSCTSRLTAVHVKGVQKSWGAKGLARFPGYGMAGMNAPIGGLAEEPVWPSGQAGEVRANFQDARLGSWEQ